MQIFLVITSYLLTAKCLEKDRKEVNPLKLTKKRIQRLYPAYLTLIIPVALAYVVLKHALPDDLVWYLFSAQNFYWVITDYTSNLIAVTAHTWYITLDVYLFLIWLLVLRMVPRRHFRTACWVAIFIAFAHRILTEEFTDSSFAVYILPFGQLDSFALGGLLAYDLKYRENTLRKLVADLILGLAGIMICMLYLAQTKSISILSAIGTFNGTNPVSNPVTANVFFFIGLLGVGLIRYCLLPIKHPILSNSYMAIVGSWTYILYMVHWPVLVVAKHFMGNTILITLSSLIVSMLLAWTWMRFVEPHTAKISKQ